MNKPLTHAQLEKEIWKQDDLVYRELEEAALPLDAESIARELEKRGLPERKRKIPTLRAVLSRLHGTRRIVAVGAGYYTIVR